MKWSFIFQRVCVGLPFLAINLCIWRAVLKNARPAILPASTTDSLDVFLGIWNSCYVNYDHRITLEKIKQDGFCFDYTPRTTLH